MDISSTCFCYWGKADAEYPGAPKWHPLVYHSLDVAACGQVLLRHHPAWLENLSRLSGLASPILSPWLIFLLAIHDLGKFGDGFQALRPDLQQDLLGRGSSVAYDARHDTLGYALVMEHLPEWLKCPDLAHRGGSLLRLWASAVNGHHGRPPKHAEWTALVFRHFPAETAFKDAEEYVLGARRLLLPEGWVFPGREQDSLDCYKQASWLVAGLAVAADWLGSNTKWFEYHHPTLSLDEYWHQSALPRAKTAVFESGMRAPTSAIDAGFTRLFPRIADNPTPLQSWANSVPIQSGPQIFVLEELTGSGKTEAALTLAARLIGKGCGHGVYFALPTMATADAMFDRVQKKSSDESDAPWQRFFCNGDASLVLAHSASGTRQKLDALQRRDAGYDERHEEASASQISTAWIADSRKKALLADFGVGTIDQALLAVMPLRHQSLRLLGMSTKVLVVDEVHACDCYMGELLARLLGFHAALGGSAVLLSATLPLEQRKKLLSAFAQGAGLAAGVPARNDYPLATHLQTTGISEAHIPARSEVSREIAVEPLANEEEVFKRLRATVDRGGCAVWIRNTVADAMEAWRAWNAEAPESPAILFHARFALCDRLDIGERIKDSFGAESGAEFRRGKLVIATQVVEQSLDVDFDDMVTDLAPIDLVIQRAGRLQRHGRDIDGNPAVREGRGGAKLGVLMPDPVQDAGADWFKCLFPRGARVYADHGRLWLTAHWLIKQCARKLALPRDARAMIEFVYGEESFTNIPAGLQKSSDDRQGACYSERSLAQQNLLSFGKGYNPESLEWPDEESNTDMPTRLGEETVRLRLAQIFGDELVPWASVDKSLDWSLSELTLPKRLVAGENSRHAEMLARSREAMQDEGRYRVIVPLAENSTGFQGWASNADGEDIRLSYSAVSGLSIEEGEEIDESDL